MLTDAIAEFLDTLKEREFDEPLLALLRAQGFTDIHFLHGSYEFGKDVIAKRRIEGKRTQFVIQSKAGDLNQSGWQSVVGQVDLLKNNTIAHPDFDTAMPRRAILVITGRLVGGALTVAQNYEQRSVQRGEPPLEVWDRDRLQEFLHGTPDALLAGSVTGPLLGVLAAINDQTITDTDVERYSASWIREGDVPTQTAAFEAALVAHLLAQSGRTDLAAVTALGLIRAVWGSVHGATPIPGGAAEMADYGQRLFVFYAGEAWNQAQGLEEDALNALNAAGGHYSTYRVLALRLIELFGLLALADPTLAGAVAVWIKQFVASNPGAAQPISDRWAVSLIPAAIVLNALDREATGELLRRVTRWTCDYYEHGGLGLAAADAGPQQEMDYLLGGAFNTSRSLSGSCLTSRRLFSTWRQHWIRQASTTTFETTFSPLRSAHYFPRRATMQTSTRWREQMSRSTPRRTMRRNGGKESNGPWRRIIGLPFPITTSVASGGHGTNWPCRRSRAIAIGSLQFEASALTLPNQLLS